MIPTIDHGRGTSDIYDLIEFNWDVAKFNYSSALLLLERFSGALWTIFIIAVLALLYKMYLRLNKIKKVPRSDDHRSPRQSVVRNQSPRRSQSQSNY